jgi:hypothetical protein
VREERRAEACGSKERKEQKKKFCKEIEKAERMWK